MTCPHLTDAACLATRREAWATVHPHTVRNVACDNCRRGIALEREEAARREDALPPGMAQCKCGELYTMGLRLDRCWRCREKNRKRARCAGCGKEIDARATRCKVTRWSPAKTLP